MCRFVRLHAAPFPFPFVPFFSAPAPLRISLGGWCPRPLSAGPFRFLLAVWSGAPSPAGLPRCSSRRAWREGARTPSPPVRSCRRSGLTPPPPSCPVAPGWATVPPRRPALTPRPPPLTCRIKKLLSLRVFDRALAPGQDGVDADGDAAGRTPSAQRWASNVVDIQGEILLGALGRWGSAGGRRFRCLWAPLFPVWVSAMWCPLVVLTGSLLGTDWLRGRAACCGPVDAFGDGPAASSRDGL